MSMKFFLELLPQPTFIIFISTFAGAFVGEFYREANDNKVCSFIKFLSKFLASWLTAVATILLIQSAFEIGKNEILMAISIMFGFLGHKESVKYAKNMIDSKFNSKKKG